MTKIYIGREKLTSVVKLNGTLDNRSAVELTNVMISDPTNDIDPSRFSEIIIGHRRSY